MQSSSFLLENGLISLSLSFCDVIGAGVLPILLPAVAASCARIHFILFDITLYFVTKPEKKSKRNIAALLFAVRLTALLSRVW